MNFVTVFYFLIFLKSHVRLYESGKYKTNSSLFSSFLADLNDG